MIIFAISINFDTGNVTVWLLVTKTHIEQTCNKYSESIIFMS